MIAIRLFSLSIVLVGVLLPTGCARKVAEKKPEAVKAAPEKAGTPEEAIRAQAQAYAKAFNARDAKALASLWTTEGELITEDGEELRGRAAIEAAYVALFKTEKKAQAEVKITSLRPLARQTYLEEGQLKVTLPGEPEPSLSRYTVVHVLTDEGWKMASVREFPASSAERVSLEDLKGLLGEWTAKVGPNELRLTYAWDETKTFIRGSYRLTNAGKTQMQGTQLIGKGHAGELRSWQFDSTGATGEWTWWRENTEWTIEATETLPNGATLTSLFHLVPLNADTFLWHSTQRELDEAQLPDLPPLKVERVKSGKKE